MGTTMTAGPFTVTDGGSCSGTFSTYTEAVEHLGRAQALWPTGGWHIVTSETQTTKTVAEMTAIITSSVWDDGDRSDLIGGSEIAWNRVLAPFGLSLDDEGCARGVASEVIDSVLTALCHQRGVTYVADWPRTPTA
jgi:hypothetical protein